MSLSARIIIGLLAGIATGLFFGELAAPLKTVGDLFVKLLQITVLPYIVVSLIAGLGRLQLRDARLLAGRAGLILLAIWALALLLVFLVATAFPALERAAFYGAPGLAAPEQPNLIELYIPANIFFSLANNMVPAVVLFSILVGVALISVDPDDKKQVLAIFEALTKAFARINQIIVSLTPYGIFAIAAAAAGTLTIDELEQVQVYLVTYVALALMVTFWVFPGLISALSGIPFREVLVTFRDTLVTAFATGNQFVVLPQIAENCKTLLARRGIDSEQTESSVDIIVPVSFNFPSLGKMLVLLFVLFAAWFTDTPLELSQRFSLAFNGLFSLFGSINVAVPHLLNSLRIPSDMFQLFLVTGIVVARFGAMLAALHIIVLGVLGTLAVTGGLTLNLRSIGRYLLLTLAGTLALVLLLRAYFAVAVPEPRPREEVLAGLHLLEEPVDARLVDNPQADPVSDDVRNRLDQVMRRGVLRVGYRARNLPCSFLTSEGELVGYDVQMAHFLARDIGVELEFSPFRFPDLPEMLETGQLDIAMSCISTLPDRMSRMAFSRPYLELNQAFIVEDHKRSLFSDLARLRDADNVVIYVVSSHYFVPGLQKMLPKARIEWLEAAEDFFTETGRDADTNTHRALLLTAEEGTAYSFRYPAYTVVPSASGVKVPVGYALPRGELTLAEFVSSWIALKREDGSSARLFEYWMRGGAVREHQPRWSVLRNVLHWQD